MKMTFFMLHINPLTALAKSEPGVALVTNEAEELEKKSLLWKDTNYN